DQPRRPSDDHHPSGPRCPVPRRAVGPPRPGADRCRAAPPLPARWDGAAGRADAHVHQPRRGRTPAL
ncbi:MAG: hypothetical protein AVDCRST_MAG66-858, partial [uncultured Pseudonocardia sp.]